MNAAGAAPPARADRSHRARRWRNARRPRGPPRRRGRGRCRARAPGAPLGRRERAERVVDRARRDLVGRARPAVVGVANAEHVAPGGGRACEAQREIVGLRSARDEEHALERRRQKPGQPLGEGRHALVEEARVRVEQAHLALRGRGHARVAVADDGDVVDAVEVGTGLSVVEVLAHASHDLGRCGVVERLGLRDHRAAAGEQLRRGTLRAGSPTSGPGCGQRASQASASAGGARPGASRPEGTTCTCRCGGRPAAGATLPTTSPAATSAPAATAGASPARRTATPSAASRSSRSSRAARRERPGASAPRCPRREDVEAEMDRGRLDVRELARGVPARLPVPADRARRRERIEPVGERSTARRASTPGSGQMPGRHTRRQCGRRAAAGQAEDGIGERGGLRRRRLADRPVTRAHALGVGVVRLERRLLLGADRDDRGARGDQVRQRLQLGVVERAGGVESAHDLCGRAERVVRLVAVGDRGRDGELADAQRARDVAEVDHAAGHQPAGAVAPADHVPVGHVAVRDLASAGAARAARSPRPPRPRRDDERAAARILDVRRERLDDGADMARVPLHRAVGGRVLEALEGARDQAGCLAQRAQDGGREVQRVDQRLALDERDEPQQIGHAVAFDRDDLTPVERRAGPRELQRAGAPRGAASRGSAGRARPRRRPGWRS